MRGWIASLVILVATAAASSAGKTMTAVDQPRPANCRVVNGQTLPLASGGSTAICAAIERAIASQAPAAHYSVEITVLSPSRLAATLVVNGRSLPEQKFAVMDSELSRATIERFAQSLALAVAEASGR